LPRPRQPFTRPQHGFPPYPTRSSGHGGLQLHAFHGWLRCKRLLEWADVGTRQKKLVKAEFRYICPRENLLLTSSFLLVIEVQQTNKNMENSNRMESINGESICSVVGIEQWEFLLGTQCLNKEFEFENVNGRVVISTYADCMAIVRVYCRNLDKDGLVYWRLVNSYWATVVEGELVSQHLIAGKTLVSISAQPNGILRSSFRGGI